MKNHVNDLFGALAPDETQKARMLRTIQDAAENQPLKAKRKRFWYAIPAIAALCLAITAVFSLLHTARSQQPLVNPRPMQTQSMPEPKATEPEAPTAPPKDGDTKLDSYNLPSMLAGQTVTWEAAQDGKSIIFVPDPIPDAIGTMADGHKITAKAELIFEGPQEEWDAMLAAHPEMVEHEPSSELGGTLSIVGISIAKEPGGPMHTTAYRYVITAVE